MPDSNDLDNWTTQIRKGVLELCIVNILAEGEVYGYELIRRLSKVKGLVVTEGTIYPLLSRLRKSGCVKTRLEESPSGPARRYYSLTPEGERLRGQMNVYWSEISRGIDETHRNEVRND